jgi:hypothetical protein
LSVIDGIERNPLKSLDSRKYLAFFGFLLFSFIFFYFRRASSSFLEALLNFSLGRVAVHWLAETNEGRAIEGIGPNERQAAVGLAK